MNTAAQFSLRWNNYVNHVTDAFNILRLENDLVDVTLCCEGGKIKAHRMLLSACSKYFKEIFKENPCQHPVIIFRNVKFEDLNAIVNFMYHGEVNIFQEQLESFLITAELLEVKGLTDGADDDNSRNHAKLPEDLSLNLNSNTSADGEFSHNYDEPINLAAAQTSKEYIPNMEIVSQSESVETEVLNMDLNNVEDSLILTQEGTDIHKNDMQIDSQIIPVEDLSEKNVNEAELGKFKCGLCPKGFKHPTSLTLHKDSHAGKTQCPVCHRSFSRSYDMRSHLQKIHQGKQLTIKEIRYKSTNDSMSMKQFTHHL